MRNLFLLIIFSNFIYSLPLLASKSSILKENLIYNECYNREYSTPYNSIFSQAKLDLEKKKSDYRNKAETLREEKIIENRSMLLAQKMKSNVAKKSIDFVNENIQKIEKQEIGKLADIELSTLQIETDELDLLTPTDYIVGRIYFCVKYTIQKKDIADFLNYKKSLFTNMTDPTPFPTTIE